MRLTVEFDREEDGRWIADVVELPGVLAYGTTQEQAFESVKAVALKTIAYQIECGKLQGNETASFTFEAA